MGDVVQTDIFGGERTLAEVRKANHPLSSAQREIVRELRARGTLRAVDAGVILHAHRAECPCTPPIDPHAPCCQYAATDGSDGLKRLAERGLAHKVSDGLCMAVNHG